MPAALLPITLLTPAVTALPLPREVAMPGLTPNTTTQRRFYLITALFALANLPTAVRRQRLRVP